MYPQFPTLISIPSLCAFLLSTAAISEAVSTAPKRTYNLSQTGKKGGPIALAAAEKARAQALGRIPASTSQSGAALNLKSASLANSAIPENVPLDDEVSAYVISMDVGTPPVSYTLLLDLGSSNTWIGAGTAYDPSASSTSVDTGLGVNATYGIGDFNGNEFKETVSFRSDDGILTATSQGLGAATSSDDFTGFADGVLGLGPVALTIGQLYDKTTGVHIDAPIPTVTDTLFAEGQIPENMVAISFKPTTSTAVAPLTGAGTVTFGGVNNDDFVGPIRYFPKSTASSVADYWGLQIDSLSFDTIKGKTITEVPLLSSPRQGILDSGSTLVALPQTVYDAYFGSFPGFITLDDFFSLIPTSQVSRIGNMTFSIGGHDFVFSPSAQIFPTEIGATFLGMSVSEYENYGYVLSVFTNFGLGSDGNAGSSEFTLGAYFMERFYSVYDTTNARMGLAYTEYSFEKTSELTSFRRARRAHREHTKRTDWSGGKARLTQLGNRSPFHLAGLLDLSST